MTDEAFEAFRKAVEDTFLSLYLIDVGSLTAEQKHRHQEALSAAYLALLSLENKRFSDLTAKAQKELAELAPRTIKLQEQLAGLKKAAETLKIVSGALNVLSSVAKLFA